MFEIFRADLLSLRRSFASKSSRYLKVVSHIYILQALILDILIAVILFSRADFRLEPINRNVALAVFSICAFTMAGAFWSRKYFSAPENPILLSMPVSRARFATERTLTVFAYSAVLSAIIFGILFPISERAPVAWYLFYLLSFALSIPVGILVSSAFAALKPKMEILSGHVKHLNKAKWDLSSLGKSFGRTIIPFRFKYADNKKAPRSANADYAIFRKELRFLGREHLGIAYSAAPLLAAALFFFVIKSGSIFPAIVAGTAIQSGILALSSVGMEGRRLWFYRSAPVEGQSVALGKGLAVVALAIPVNVGVTVLLCALSGAGLAGSALYVITATSLALVFAANGLWIGTGMPNLDESLFGLPDSAGLLIWSITTAVIAVGFIGIPEFAAWLALQLGISPFYAKLPAALALLFGAFVIFRESTETGGKYIDALTDEECR